MGNQFSMKLMCFFYWNATLFARIQELCCWAPRL